MSLRSGDILYDLNANMHLLLHDMSEFEDETGVWQTWNFLVLETGENTWWYADYLEEEKDFMRVA